MKYQLLYPLRYGSSDKSVLIIKKQCVSKMTLENIHLDLKALEAKLAAAAEKGKVKKYNKLVKEQERLLEIHQRLSERISFHR